MESLFYRTDYAVLNGRKERFSFTVCESAFLMVLCKQTALPRVKWVGFASVKAGSVQPGGHVTLD